MTLRKHLVGSRPFASIGASLDINSWDSRLQTIRAELLTDVPCLTELKASSLALQFEPTTHGVNLIVLLAESPQFQLQHLSEDDVDLFVQDIKRVHQDQRSIEDRITLAISGSANPSDEPEVARIRQRLRVPRNSNGVTIWSSPTAKILPLFELPKVLPLGGQRPLPVRVTKLTRLWAEIRLCEDLQMSDCTVVRASTTMTLKRFGDHCKPASGTILSTAMDEQSILKIVAAIVIDWDTGRPSSLELIAFDDLSSGVSGDQKARLNGF